MAAAGKGRVKLVLGTMEFGRGPDEAAMQRMVEQLIATGNVEVDTALMYTGGQSETILGRLPACTDAANGVKIATKANPWNDQGLQPASVLSQLATSLGRLKLSQVDLFYLHAPDHKTPIEETLRAVQQLYTEGKFLRFGLSNFAAWQVAEIYHICKQNGWVLPTVYQGMYNAMTRSVEPELFPCLRKFGISFYVYNPLAGGLLTGRYTYEDLATQPAGRFFTTGGKWADAYRDRFWKKEYFQGLDLVRNALTACYGDNSVTLTCASLRWLAHHSKLDPAFGDAIILGASKLGHLEENLAGAVGGPLEKPVVEAFDQAWQLAKPMCAAYFR